jgi:DnaJ family protein C protein 7
MYLRALVLFLTSSLPQAITNAQSALRFDQEHIAARKLLKRVRGVERLKEEGNAAFKSGQISEAVTKYTECLDAIGEKDEEGKGGQIRATLLSNRATALLKVRIFFHIELSLKLP